LVCLVDLVLLVSFVQPNKQDKPNKPDQPERARLADEVWVEPIDGLDRESFDFVVDGCAAYLAKARKDPLHNHLVAFSNFDLTEADDFQRAGRILQEKPIGRLTLPVCRKLDVGDLAGDHHFLAVVLLRVGEELGNFEKS